VTHTLKRNLRILAGLAVGALFVYLFANKLDWSEVWVDLGKAEWGRLSLAGALIVGTYVIRSLRWRTLLPAPTRPSFMALMRATVVGFTALFLMGRAAEMIVRPAALSMKERISPSTSYATVLIERVFDMVMVVIFFAANLAFFEFTRRDSESTHTFGVIRITGISLLLVSGAGIYGLSVFRSRRAAVLSYVERKCARLPGALSNGITGLLRQISEGLAVLHNARGLAVVVSYTVLLWLLVVGAYLLVIRAFAVPPEQIPVTGAVFVMGLSMLGSVVPTPGASTGPFHAATAASLVFLGVERNKAASAAILLHLVIFMPAIMFGVFYLLKDGISLARLMHVGEQPTSLGLTPGGLVSSGLAAGSAESGGFLARAPLSSPRQQQLEAAADRGGHESGFSSELAPEPIAESKTA
jgi:uncharacterized protein (TIRG00374 family)